MNPYRREELRQREVAAIPSWYSPWAHLGFPTAVGLGLLAAAVAVMQDVTPLELLTIPAVFLFSNAFEWRVHKSILHQRRPGLTVLYDRHTPVHHIVFTEDDMAVRSPKEWRLVLIPAYGVVLVALIDLPLAFGLDLLGLRNVAALFVVTSVLYVVSYEWMHLSYHLPPGSWAARLWLVRVLRKHHARHHDPELMQAWNFNVTFPLWDWVRGTIHRR